MSLSNCFHRERGQVHTWESENNEVPATSSKSSSENIPSLDYITNHENSYTFDEDELPHGPIALQDFKSAIKQIDNFSCPMEEGYLLRFLRTKKFNIVEAIELMRRYFTLKIEYDHMSTVKISAYKEIYDSKIHMVLKHRDKLGRKVLFVRAKKWNPNVITIDQLNMSTFFLLHEMTSNAETQIKGCMFILDCSGIGFSQARSMLAWFTPSQINRMIVFLGGYPLRFKGVHSFNAPYIFEAAFNVSKYILKKKIRDRLHVHRSGFKTLFKYFSPEILPQYLGGHLTEDEAEDHELMTSLYAKEEYYHDHWKHGFHNRN